MQGENCQSCKMQEIGQPRMMDDCHRRRLTQGNGDNCPDEKLLRRRCATKKWTQLQLCFFVSLWNPSNYSDWCHDLQSAINIHTLPAVLTYLCRKLHLLLGKSTRTSVYRAALFDSNMQQIVGWGFTPDPTGELKTLPHTPLLFLRPTSKGKGKERSRG